MKFLILSIVVAFLSLVSGQSCPEPDRSYPDPQQCDKYIQCTEGVPEEKLCPDGLVYDEFMQEIRFPCVYPAEIDCGSRTKLQPAQPTQRCARAWGYFGTGDRADCGIFWNCVDRREYLFNCPEGLAFSSATNRCEYPENSPDCDVSEFLGFTCPSVRDEAQILLVGTPRYSSPRDCNKYFLCVGGSNPRLMTCDIGTVFNDAIHGCDEPENVQSCQNYYSAEELASIRERKVLRKIVEEKKRQRIRERIAAINISQRIIK